MFKGIVVRSWLKLENSQDNMYYFKVVKYFVMYGHGDHYYYKKNRENSENFNLWKPIYNKAVLRLVI